MIAETAISIALKKGSSYLAKQFGSQVMTRWSKYRAESFFETLTLALAQGKPDWEIAPILDEILQDEKKTEVLFEAYRSVSLSRGKNVGPRAIGLLVGNLIAQNREANDEEDKWLYAFESLSDSELTDASKWILEWFAKARDGSAQKSEKYSIKYSELIVEWCSELTEFKADADRSPLDLHEYVGSWAAKLAGLGILRARITEKVWDYPEDSEAHVDEAGTARRITHEIVFDLSGEKYASLILRAERMVPINSQPE